MQDDVIPVNHIVNYITQLPVYVRHHLNNCINTDSITIDSFKKALETACINFDVDMYQKKVEYGATCVFYIIDKTFTNSIYLVNIGDSRAIIFNNKTGLILTETADHNPNNIMERNRIIDAGRYVFFGRVDGELAVARSFGDYKYKNTKTKEYDPIEGAVSAVPDVYQISMKTLFMNTYDHDIAIMLTSDSPFDRYNNKWMVDNFIMLQNEGSTDDAVTKLVALFHDEMYCGDDSTVVVTIL
jgi:serine/threonine protein phosphatase PrpC